MFPLTLDTLLHGSGVEKDGALDEHRAALLAVSASADADAGAIEWLLYDWLMAHRESERSAAIEIRFGRPADAAMIVAAAAVSSARARTRTVIGLSEIGPPLIGRPHLRGRG